VSEDGGFRRLNPPPRRRAGLHDLLLRWRVEILVAATAYGLWWFLGWLGLAMIAAGAATLTVVSRPVRKIVVGYALGVVVTHRVRVGFVQAGVGDREGKLPWLVFARPGADDDVIVSVWLRAGTTIGDLRIGAPIVAAACGARSVTVTQLGPRSDRVVLAVVRPRWPFP
jgi:hypothetical protein